MVVHSLCTDWGKLQLRPGDGGTVDRSTSRRVFCWEMRARPLPPRRKVRAIHTPIHRFEALRWPARGSRGRRSGEIRALSDRLCADRSESEFSTGCARPPAASGGASGPVPGADLSANGGCWEPTGAAERFGGRLAVVRPAGARGGSARGDGVAVCRCGFVRCRCGSGVVAVRRGERSRRLRAGADSASAPDGRPAEISRDLSGGAPGSRPRGGAERFRASGREVGVRPPRMREAIGTVGGGAPGGSGERRPRGGASGFAAVRAPGPALRGRRHPEASASAAVRPAAPALVPCC